MHSLSQQQLSSETIFVPDNINYQQEQNNYISSSWQFSPDTYPSPSQSCSPLINNVLEQQTPLEEQQPLELNFLEDLNDLDQILNQLDTTELFSELEKIESNDSSNFTNQSIFENTNNLINDNNNSISVVQRKLSTDSSDYSVSSPSNYFESPFSSPLSNDTNIVDKTCRTRRPKRTKEERAARKKDQNKKAASRYRNKIKTQTEFHEQILEQLEQRKDELTTQCKKIQTEFDVILPLAKAAFRYDPIRSKKLEQLLNRLSKSI